MPLNKKKQIKLYFKQLSLAKVQYFGYTQLNVKTILFQIQFSIIHRLNAETILFQTIQFSISTQFSSIWPIDRTLSVATTPGQRGPGSNGNKGVFRNPQNASITEASTSSDCLVS